MVTQNKSIDEYIGIYIDISNDTLYCGTETENFTFLTFSNSLFHSSMWFHNFFFLGYILSFWVIKFCVHCLNKKMELGLSLTYLYRKKKKKILTQALAFYEKQCRSIINLLVNGQILKQRYLIDHRKFNESDRQQSISHVSNWIPLNYL